MRKVLMLASVPSMIGQFNMENIQLLQNMGYRVEVACNFSERSVWTEERITKFKEELEKKEIVSHQIDFSRNMYHLGRHACSYRQLKSLLQKEQYVFIHCHTPIAGAIGRIAGHAAGIKVIYTAHGFHFYKGASIKNWLLFYPIERFLSRWTETLITINQEDYERAKRFHAKKVEYVPGVGVDIEKIEAVQADRKKKREELGIPEDAFVLLSVGELNKNKNHITVIRALRELGKSDIHYVICGQGSLKKYLMEQSCACGMEGRVHLLGFRKDVYEIYKISDLYVHPSYREGMPVALMEAMASGMPVICSAIRGNTDLLLPKSKNMFQPGCVREVADNIQKIINSTGQKLRKEGKENAMLVSSFSRNNVRNKMERIYRLIC